jgi:hypothetical protein
MTRDDVVALAALDTSWRSPRFAVGVALLDATQRNTAEG